MYFRKCHLIKILVLLLVPWQLSALSIEEKLEITNSGIVDSSFFVDVQVRGDSLPEANTLGSATIDVMYDSSKLEYVKSSDFAFTAVQGYNFSVSDNDRFIRIGILGVSVGPAPNKLPGYDIVDTLVTWVRLEFTIKEVMDEADVSNTIGIDHASNAIGLFESHGNETDTGVIIDIDTGVMIMSVDVPHNAVIPEAFDLEPNFPNPFNPQTRITYRIPVRAEVSLVVYNMLGAEVTTLVHEEKGPGHFAVDWNGRNDAGRQVASGVYLYVLKAGDFVGVGKMLLLR